MDKNVFCDAIGFCPVAFEELALRFGSPAKDEVDAFYADSDGFLNSVKQRESDFNAYMLNFYLQVGSTYALPYFLKQGVDERVMLDTLKDIALWSEIYFHENNRHGISDSEVTWLIPHMKGQIFTLGSLQFKPAILDENITLSGGSAFKKGQKSIEIHIPRGGSLSPKSIDEAFAFASRLFGSNNLYSCYSWLLSPTLKQILPPHSNILDFASRFDITCEISDNTSANRYLNYAAAVKGETTLTRKAKTMPLGCGLGWIVL